MDSVVGKRFMVEAVVEDEVNGICGVSVKWPDGAQSFTAMKREEVIAQLAKGATHDPL